MTTASPPLCPSHPPRVFGAPTLHTESELLALGMNIDGTLWSVEEPGLLRQWTLATRRLQGKHPLDELATVWTFNWAGRLLASGSDEVAVWEVASGEQLVGWAAPSWVTALAFQPGHPVLATGHDDGLVQVWEWTEHFKMCEIAAHSRAVSAAAFSPDGTRFATAGEDRLIHVWELPSGKKLATLKGHTGRIPALCWHPDGKRLFSAGWDTTVRVWDAATGEPIILLNSHAREVHAAALSADGRLLASADADSAVHIWDTNSYHELAVLRTSTAEIRCLCWTPDDDKGNLRPSMLAYGGADRVIYLWDSRQGPDVGPVTDTLLSRTNIAVSPDGGTLYGLGGGTDLRCWATDSGEAGPPLEDSPVLRSFALSPDGRWIAASRAIEEGRSALAIHHAGSGHRGASCEGQAGPVTALAFSPSSSLLASAGFRSCDVWLWTVPGGSAALLLNDALEGCSVEALAWHPGGHLLAVGGIDWMATGGSDGEVVVWDPHARKVHLRFPGGVTALAYRPDGTLAAAGLNRVIRLIDGGGGVRELAGHDDTILCVAFSKNGQWLASGGEDRTIRLWDASTGRQIAAWELENVVRAVAFGPEGKYLYTGNGNTSCCQIEIERLLA